jgi:glycosyltransferase involved in cell wall biosynthesis
MKLLIIIPAYNESQNIKCVVNNLITKYPQYDYIVVNDGSRDNTADICRANEYNFLDFPVNLGLASAFQIGIKFAYRNGYDMAVQLDGDGQHNPLYIEDMIQEMERSKADIVIGSRFKNVKQPLTLRMIGSKLISFAIRLTTGTRISDPTSGMRLFNRNMLKEFANEMNYGPEPDTLSYLMRNGANVSEVQVEMSERTAGESYLTLARSMRYMLHMVTSIIFLQWFRKREV